MPLCELGRQSHHGNRRNRPIINKQEENKSIYMNETKQLVDTIKESIQEKKGKRIVIADLTGIAEAMFDYFVICEGESPTQVSAIVRSVDEGVKKAEHIDPASVAGLQNAQWVAMDYADVVVHVFQPDARRFYNLEHLWADAQLTEIPDEL